MVPTKAHDFGSPSEKSYSTEVRDRSVVRSRGRPVWDTSVAWHHPARCLCVRGRFSFATLVGPFPIPDLRAQTGELLRLFVGFRKSGAVFKTDLEDLPRRFGVERKIVRPGWLIGRYGS